MASRADFAGALCGALGAPATGSNIAFLTDWMAREGTNAGNNPLATTLPWPGSTDFNSVGVKNYATFNDGVGATAQTLRVGYPRITNDLRAGNGDAARNEAAELSKWSGGGYNHVGGSGSGGDIGSGTGGGGGGGDVSGDSWLGSVGSVVGEILIDLVGLIGLGLGGGSAAAAPWLKELSQDAFYNDTNVVLTPAELATAVVKSQLDFGRGSDEARYSGLDHERFDLMVRTTGNPPGPMELLEMVRRGIIAPPDVELGMREGFLRNEWVGPMMQLREHILGVADAVAAAVQNHLPYDTAADAAGLNGVPRQVFDLLYQNAGNPPGPMELLNLWVRGYIDEPAVDQGLRESRLKDKWIGPLKQLSVRKIPLRTITSLLNNGALTDAQAMQHLRELGYSVEDAQALIAGHKKPPTAPHRELSTANIRDLYQQRIINRDEAVNDLVTLGFNAPQANELLTIVDTAQTRQLRKAAVSRVRSAYDARKLSRAEASRDLDALGVAANLRDETLALWDLELASNHAVLTPTDICGAGHVGLFTEDEVLRRLQAHGYSADDARVFAIVHHGIAPPPTGA